MRPAIHAKPENGKQHPRNRRNGLQHRDSRADQPVRRLPRSCQDAKPCSAQKGKAKPRGEPEKRVKQRLAQGPCSYRRYSVCTVSHGPGKITGGYRRPSPSQITSSRTYVRPLCQLPYLPLLLLLLLWLEAVVKPGIRRWRS
ncbi:hypothetical protein ABE38_13515 [Brevibacillus agri]|nr:hypothetical protein [Brevibacillus agri]